jgi:hypothetical protein
MVEIVPVGRENRLVGNTARAAISCEDKDLLREVQNIKGLVDTLRKA